MSLTGTGEDVATLVLCTSTECDGPDIGAGSARVAGASPDALSRTEVSLPRAREATMNRTISTINVLPKHRRQRMANLMVGHSITVCAHTVEDIREDLKVLGEDDEILWIEPVDDGMVEVSIW